MNAQKRNRGWIFQRMACMPPMSTWGYCRCFTDVYCILLLLCLFPHMLEKLHTKPVIAQISLFEIKLDTWVLKRKSIKNIKQIMVLAALYSKGYWWGTRPQNAGAPHCLRSSLPFPHMVTAMPRHALPPTLLDFLYIVFPPSLILLCLVLEISACVWTAPSHHLLNAGFGSLSPYCCRDKHSPRHHHSWL